MAFKLRPTGLGAMIDKDPGEWAVGRIYQTRGGPDRLRWFWSLLEEAKAQFRKSWDAWKAWAKLEEAE